MLKSIKNVGTAKMLIAPLGYGKLRLRMRDFTHNFCSSFFFIFGFLRHQHFSRIQRLLLYGIKPLRLYILLY